MISRKIRTTISGIAVVCVLLLAIVLGLVFGYRVVLRQKARYDYMQQIAAQQELIQDIVNEEYSKQLKAEKKDKPAAQQNAAQTREQMQAQNKIKAERCLQRLAAWKKEKNIPLNYSAPIPGEKKFTGGFY